MQEKMRPSITAVLYCIVCDARLYNQLRLSLPEHCYSSPSWRLRWESLPATRDPMVNADNYLPSLHSSYTWINAARLDIDRAHRFLQLKSFKIINRLWLIVESSRKNDDWDKFLVDQWWSVSYLTIYNILFY